MSDFCITDKLRMLAAGASHPGSVAAITITPDMTAQVALDAADEIDRLRAREARLREAAVKVTDHCGPINKGLNVDFMPVSLSDWRKLRRALKDTETSDDG
jgi:predicted aconitase